MTTPRRNLIRRNQSAKSQAIQMDLFEGLDAEEIESLGKEDMEAASKVEIKKWAGRYFDRKQRVASRQVKLDRPLFALDSPGMPLPGAQFSRLAVALGDDYEVQKAKGGKKTGKQPAKLLKYGSALESLFRNCLYSEGTELPFKGKNGRQRSLVVVPGHLWGASEDAAAGPRPATVMVISKMLGMDEKQAGRNLVGQTGDLLADTLQELGATASELAGWYVTSLVKTEHPEAEDGQTTLSQTLINEWLPLLHQELRLVRPRYVLCLGADASKAVLGKSASVKYMEGRVVEHQFSISQEAGPEGEVLTHSSLVMTCTHPNAVIREQSLHEQMTNQLSRFLQLSRGNRWDLEVEGIDHRVIDTLDALKDLYYEIKADCEDNLLAVDAEWHGEHPANEGSYVRSVQVSWRNRAACSLALRKPGGDWQFDCDEATVAKWFMRICRGRRVCGQFFNSDLEWLIPMGIDLRPHFKVAASWEQTMQQALRKQNPKGGFDTGLAAHALNETDDFSLTSLALRHTTAPRYDVELVKWRDEYCNKHGFKKKDMEGYGECPDDILHPYGCYDADVTRRLALVFQQRLLLDRFENNCWEPFWMSMRATPAALEISTAGVLIDRERLDTLTEMYLKARDELKDKIREWAKWPEMNLDSVQHVKEFLFGERYNGKKRVDQHIPIRLRPNVAKSLKLTPLLTTDKRPMRWSEVVQRQLEDQKSPSTDKLSLAILAQDNQQVSRWHPIKKCYIKYDLSKQVTWIRDYRFISQVLKNMLRTPIVSELTEEFVRDKDGFYVYPGGLPGAICTDGRVRTHIYLTKETGRWSSARPPLQNLSNRRETDYKRILGKLYRWKLRSIVMASPGCVLIGADYTGAELFGMAVMSGDRRMIEHARRNILPETDPNYYDIHSNVAVMAFGLKCNPTKGGLKSIGKEHLRILAKAVIFGIAYGRGAKAIALSAKEEGINISVDDAQQVINAIFRMYKELVPFFEGCRKRSLRERWLCGSFGRFRRFSGASDFQAQGDIERQAMNFPIQNLVADAVARAADYLYYSPEHLAGLFQILLQLHDAFLFEVPTQHVPLMFDEVLPECMVRRVPIYPTTLDGMPAGTGPYTLGFDAEPYLHWGERMTPHECLDCGFDPKYAGWQATDGGYLHPQLFKKIWRDGQLLDLAV